MDDSEVKNRGCFKQILCLHVLQHVKKSQDTAEIITLNIIPMEYWIFLPNTLNNTFFCYRFKEKKKNKQTDMK